MDITDWAGVADLYYSGDYYIVTLF